MQVDKSSINFTGSVYEIIVRNNDAKNYGKLTVWRMPIGEKKIKTLIQLFQTFCKNSSTKFDEKFIQKFLWLSSHVKLWNNATHGDLFKNGFIQRNLKNCHTFLWNIIHAKWVQLLTPIFQLDTMAKKTVSQDAKEFYNIMYCDYHCAEGHSPAETVSTTLLLWICRGHVPVYLFNTCTDAVFLHFQYGVSLFFVRI